MRFRTVHWVVGLVVIGLTMVWARAFYGSMQAYHQGEAYLNENQYIKAITFFDRSIHWYTPFNPYVRQSAERLWEIGLKAEQKGYIRISLIAVRAIRRGFYAARSFYGPGKDWIRKCDVKINDLMRIEQDKSETRGSPNSLDKPTPMNQEATSPASLWSIVVVSAFLGWIGSVIGFIMFACKGDRKVRLLAYPGLAWASLALIFFALWLVGMMKA